MNCNKDVWFFFWEINSLYFLLFWILIINILKYNILWLCGILYIFVFYERGLKIEVNDKIFLF